MKIGAIITARSNSARYPRKHLGILGGKPMIVQIIDKLNQLENLDQVILSTTTNPEDDDLCDIAHNSGADLNRGSEHNLLERDLQAIDTFKLDAVLVVSGDWPFISNAGSQLLIDGYRATDNPEQYTTVNGSESLSEMTGFLGHICTKKYYEIFKKLIKKYEHKYSYEQYWQADVEEPELFKILNIDTSSIMDPTITPMNMTIDWNLQRLFFNKIIDYLGFYPETIADFNRAYGGIREL